MREIVEEPIASRKIRSDGPKGKAITIHIGKPRKSRGRLWECPYFLQGMEMQKVEYGRGVDGIQAILMTIEVIRQTLEESGKRFSWSGGQNGDFGLPHCVPTYYGIDFSKKMGRMIENEVTKFVRKNKKR